jgi:hypothetical protein
VTWLEVDHSPSPHPDLPRVRSSHPPLQPLSSVTMVAGPTRDSLPHLPSDEPRKSELDSFAETMAMSTGLVVTLPRDQYRQVVREIRADGYCDFDDAVGLWPVL